MVKLTKAERCALASAASNVRWASWFIDLSGQRFGRLAVVRILSERKGERVVWECRCECGRIVNVTGHDLRAGHTKSCGCLQVERQRAGNLKHGMRFSAEYGIWCAMIDRCRNMLNKRYTDYGGRGINVAPEFETFEGFFSAVGPRPAAHTLERIENSKGYEPGNVRWATRVEQGRNTRANHLLTYKGKTQPMAAWAEESSLSYDCIKRRKGLGWTDEQALSLPKGYRLRPKQAVNPDTREPTVGPLPE
jgi:hypothetical protein